MDTSGNPVAAENATGDSVPNVTGVSSDDPLMFLRGAGYIAQGFPAPGLRRTIRHITGHNDDGKAVFLSSDCGDHHRIIGEQQALGNILYSTFETPVDMNNNKDLEHAKEHEPPIHYQHGTVLRLIDFAPGLLSPMHRSVSLDYGVVLDGEFELILDSGETRSMRQGDVSINRGGAHSWRNITSNGTMPGRMLYFLVDSKPIITAKGEALGEELAELAPYYVQPE
ncbi:hypothetical protein S40293_09887 [Stachybotrys chartarum IBT 40293]|nr:hypothetical protein S40293_09887 [Stachybotrys chartarum IBT 40293]